MKDELISRQAAIDALKAMAVPRYKDLACEDIWERDRTLENAIVAIRGLPSAQGKSCEYWDAESNYCTLSRPSAEPEIRPIDYQDCSNAMLKMWMDNVVTDGEYNRIMDKLNAHWRKKNE